MDKLSKRLKETGVTVVPFFTHEQVKEIQHDLEREMGNFPEYKHPVEDGYVLGGFGAFGNPASFHNPTIRELRLKCKKKAKKILRQVYPGMFFDPIPDRFCIRRAGTSVTGETFHRDVSDIDYSTDFVIGGWVNLSDSDHYFSAVLGSHNIPFDEIAGFQSFDKERQRQYRSETTTTIVPPGHWIGFPSHIIHEVKNHKVKEDQMRLFQGYRISSIKHPTNMHPNLFELFDRQAPLPVGSGQGSPMYAMNHISFWQDKTVEWSKRTFKDPCLQTKRGKRGEYTVVDRFMKGLEEYGFEMYPKYDDKEKKRYLPRKLK